MVPGGGLEPPRPYGQRILSPLRLPIPPPGLQVWERAGRKYGQLPKLKFENEIDRKTMETQLAHMDDILFVAKTYGHLRDTHSCEMAKLVE